MYGYTHTHARAFILLGDVHITWSINCGMMRWKIHPVLGTGREASSKQRKGGASTGTAASVLYMRQSHDVKMQGCRG